MFMLMGIVKKNGIMIVDFAIQRVAQGESAENSIHEASIDRFRPILMTTLAAVMGAVPIALGWGADGASRRPLGLVVVGGLLVSQLITLYITPVIYLYMELFQEKVLDRTDSSAPCAPIQRCRICCAGRKKSRRWLPSPIAKATAMVTVAGYSGRAENLSDRHFRNIRTALSHRRYRLRRPTAPASFLRRILISTRDRASYFHS